MDFDLFGNPICREAGGNKKRQPKHPISHYRARIDSFYHTEIDKDLEKTGVYDMPVIRANTFVPQTIHTIPFDRARTSSGTDRNQLVIFYNDDYRFAPALNHPWDYVGILSSYIGVIGPDLSQYNDMDYAKRIYNSYWNKALTAYLQNRGVNVYPNVTWNLPSSYKYSVAGYPRESVIVINSIGALYSNYTQGLWLSGYNYMLEALQPIWILRHGPKVPGELTEISTYLLNDELEIMKSHGRKRNWK